MRNEQMPSSDVLESEIDGNYAAFMEKLEGLLREHRSGQFALMRNRAIVQLFDSAADAIQFGRKAFGDHIFSVQEVRERPFDLGYFSHGGPYADI
jgi:hypothetical protein